MSNTVRILRSTTPSAVPSSLVSGQIAINEADGKLFYRNGSGAVTQLATGGGGGGTELYSFANTASFPATGVTTALYLSIASGRVYQWNGSVYSEVGPVGGGGSLSASVTVPASGDPYWSTVGLLLRGDGDNNGTTFADSGPKAKTVTRVGGAVTSTAQSKFGGASLYFDGADDQLEVGTSFDADVAGFGTGDFTIEFWFRAATTATRMSVLSAYNAVSPATGLVVQLNKDDGGGPVGGSVSLGYGDNPIVSTGAGVWSANTWTHLAVVRSGGTATLYVNGVSQASAASSTNISEGRLQSIGGLYLSGSYIQHYSGYLDDLRITKAARYTANFTPPTATYATGTYAAAQTLPVVGTGSIGSGLAWSPVPASATATGTAGQIAWDSSGRFYLCTATNTWKRATLSTYDFNYDYTLLLAHFDGTISDSGPLGLPATVGGSATTSSTTTKFGGGAAYFPSGSNTTSDVIKFGSGSAWNLMGADFTIEAWVYATSNSNYQGLISRDNQSDRRNWNLFIDFDGVKPVTFFVFNTSGASFLTIADSQAFPLNEWVHVAAVRDAGVFRLYKNGIQVASAAASGGTGTMSTASGPLSIGALNENGNYGFTGYIDEVRVLNRCAYPSGTTFTPPSAAYSNA